MMIGTIFQKPIQDNYLTIENVVTDTFTETIQVPDETSETGFRNEEVTRTEERIEYERVKNPAPNTREAYAIMAGWCNRNNARIVDKGDYYEVVALPEPTVEEIAEQELQQKKSERAEAVSRIVVEVDGIPFDGDEKAQERMSRAVSTARARADRLYNKAVAEWIADQPEGTFVDASQSGIVKDDYMTYETTWVLADSTYTTVTISQLSEACELAGQTQTELWIKPYEEK